jgi:hypothetical protein
MAEEVGLTERFENFSQRVTHEAERLHGQKSGG